MLHIASPLGHGGDDDEALITAARDGNPARAGAPAVAAGVGRVVMTSSTAACTPAKPVARALDETDWTDPEQPGLAAYRKSKVLAERAAWDLIGGQSRTSLTTILPGAIFGPVLTQGQQGSVGIIRGLLNGQPPALPRLALSITDVRGPGRFAYPRHGDAFEATGERFIALGDAPVVWRGGGRAAIPAGQTVRPRFPGWRCPTWWRADWQRPFRRR